MNYKKRFKDEAEQNAYMNACDCLYYGYGPKDWNDCGIDQERRRTVWDQAFHDMTESED